MCVLRQKEKNVAEAAENEKFKVITKTIYLLRFDTHNAHFGMRRECGGFTKYGRTDRDFL
jgi:hypothetical protein